MFGNFKFPIIVLAICVMVEEATCTPGCKQAKKKCKKKTPHPVMKSLKLGGQNETAKLFPKGNESVSIPDIADPLPLELPEKYRTESFEVVYFPSGIDMVPVELDGIPWAWPQDKLHMLKNSTAYKTKRSEDVPKLLTTNGNQFRIVTKDGFCIEVYNDEVQELECKNHEWQTFSLTPTAMSDTFLIRGPHSNCITRGGSLQICDPRNTEQKFVKRRKQFYMVGDDGLLCPLSRGTGGRAFEMTQCPAVVTYWYQMQIISETLPSPEYHRMIDGDGFCIAIFGNMIKSQLCSADKKEQMLRKVEQPGGTFRIQSPWRQFMREVSTNDDRNIMFDVTFDFGLASSFSFNKILNKLVTGKSQCVTMYCTAGRCDPRNKFVVPRPCTDGWADQLFQIQPFHEGFGSYKKSWSTISIDPGTFRVFRCMVQGDIPDECQYNTPNGSPQRWFKTTQYEKQGSAFLAWSTTCVKKSIAVETKHFMFVKEDTTGIIWSCDRGNNMCSGLASEFVTASVINEVYK